MIISVKIREKDGLLHIKSTDNLKINDFIVIETDRGKFIAKVYKIASSNITISSSVQYIKKATKDDYNTYLNNLKDANKALKETKKIVKNMSLNMNVISAIYSLDRKHLIFEFVSNERVDFRELVKELANLYHTRIDLFQIGVRDKASSVGGLGLCGRTLCCSNNLKQFCSVNINTIKNQNIALNPSKINGVCGRLLCCFNFENDLYVENVKKMPKVDEKVVYNGKKGKVSSIDILNKKYTIKFENGLTETVIIDD